MTRKTNNTNSNEPERLAMQTVNKADENFARLAELFPNAVTETTDENGKVVRAVDADLLRQEISTSVVEGPQERYQFTWPDKKKSILAANAPINKTLRPCPEESVDFERTENLYIEGDNLDVLKLLRETYLGKVKMIYIDPPYNTGNDFVYNDNFAEDADEYLSDSGQYDEEGNRLVQNTESNGRFHTDWLNMIYPRLKTARDLLSDDGVIFISIDDNEEENLKKVCNEIFGESNFVACVNWKARGGRQDSKYYAAVHEYILVFAKDITCFQVGEDIQGGKAYPLFDTEKQRYYKKQLLRKWGANSRREDRPNLYYPISAPDGSEIYPVVSVTPRVEGCWRWKTETMQEAIANDCVEFVKQEDGSWIAYEKIYAPSGKEENTKKYTTWIDEKNDGTTAVSNLFEAKVFDYPKSPTLCYRFFKMANIMGNDIVLDFFSGSATTAHAVMQLNAERAATTDPDSDKIGGGGHGGLRYIMVQLPEICPEGSEAAKAGYKNICEIGKERIRRAGKKIKEASPLTTGDLDIGFRVLKLDSSNMENVYYNPHEIRQGDLFSQVDNIKRDRKPEDLLFQVMLELGVSLSSRISTESIGKTTIYSVADGYLVACFAEKITEAVVTEIARKKPYFAIFRDSGFDRDSTAVNFKQIFATYSQETKIRKL